MSKKNETPTLVNAVKEPEPTAAEALAEFTEQPTSAMPADQLEELTKATSSPAHTHAETLSLILNGNIDPRTIPEAQRDEIRAFLRNAADALTGTKGA